MKTILIILTRTNSKVDSIAFSLEKREHREGKEFVHTNNETIHSLQNLDVYSGLQHYSMERERDAERHLIQETEQYGTRPTM